MVGTARLFIFSIQIDMETLFLHYLVLMGWWVYGLIFIGMIVEGETFLFAAIYMAHLGYLNLKILLVVVFLGLIFSDFFWYFVGEFLERKSKFVRKWMGRVSQPLDSKLHKRPMSTIFMTRFAYGIYHATLMRAGALKISLKLYFKTVVISSAVWVSLIGGVAYFSSIYIGLFKKYLKYGEIALLVAIIIFLFLSHFISKYTKREIEKNENN